MTKTGLKELGMKTSNEGNPIEDNASIGSHCRRALWLLAVPDTAARARSHARRRCAAAAGR